MELSSRLITAATTGIAGMGLLARYAPLEIGVAAAGVVGCVAVGLQLAQSERQERLHEQQRQLLASLRAPLALSSDPDLFPIHRDLSRSLVRLAQQSNDVLREYSLLKLFAVAEEMRALASGRIVFTATEGWRQVYERILQDPEIIEYRSVAWLRSEDYWRDMPGQRSLQLNLELIDRGVTVERTLIICDFLWPPGAQLPVGDVRKWIDLQHQRGICIHLVRESELLGEIDLLQDVGIYGERAVGMLELDETARTQRFVVHFDRQSIELAKDRWKKLSLYTVKYGDLLDRSSPVA